MRKNVLALSIATMIGGMCLAGAASASVLVGNGPFNGTTQIDFASATTMSFAEAGVGHILLVPYFTAQNGNMTVIHVVNTDTTNGKAVKVRFRSAANSDDILDFQVFMSPGDVWTAAVSAGATGGAQIVTADNTCTVPRLAPGVAQPFVTNRLNQALVGDNLLGLTREGYVEIFNMADIPVNTTGTTAAPTLYQAIKHISAVAPCSVVGSAAATKLNSAATSQYPTEASAATMGFNTPTGGLMGDWYIINVPQTTTYSGAATAVVATAAGVSARGNFVHFPQIQDAVDPTQINNFTSDPLFRTNALDAAGVDYLGTFAAIAAANYDLPDLSTPYVTNPGPTAAPAQASLLTQALAVQSVTNQYANDASITAKTDWVFSMPTRRYSVAANYAVASTVPAYRLFTPLTSSWFVASNTPVSTNGSICVVSNGQAFYDREETTTGQIASGPVFSPGTITAQAVPQFCGEVSVLSYADAGNSVLGASAARQNLATGSYVNGWSKVITTNGGPGLPIIGAAFLKLSNPNVGTGLSGTYGITWPHRYTR